MKVVGNGRNFAQSKDFGRYGLKGGVKEYECDGTLVWGVAQ
jgi:hypothetical protein